MKPVGDPDRQRKATLADQFHIARHVQSNLSNLFSGPLWNSLQYRNDCLCPGSRYNCNYCPFFALRRFVGYDGV
jgi:hypothetical protein